MAVLGLGLSQSAFAGSPACQSGAAATFSATGGEQCYTVPAGVTEVHVVAVGAPSGSGEKGASVNGEVTVTAGQTLYIEVGDFSGFNGGGAGGTGGNDGATGGGASDVRSCAAAACALSTDDTRLLVAGGAGGDGGGGSGTQCYGSQSSSDHRGGAAGTAGGNGDQCQGMNFGGLGGGAGGASAGGSGGAPGSQGGAPGGSGALGSGGAGGNGSSAVQCAPGTGTPGVPFDPAFPFIPPSPPIPCLQVSDAITGSGGGGGGGFYGGGGGASGGNAAAGGGGGGGSSYGGTTSADTTGTPLVRIVAGAQSANAKPVASTGAASSVTPVSATLNATVNPNGQATTYHFEFGTSTAYGQRTVDASAGSGSGDQAESASVTGLQPLTTYHFRVVATSAGGSTSGGDLTFTTTAAPQPQPTPKPQPKLPPPSISDTGAGSTVPSPAGVLTVPGVAVNCPRTAGTCSVSATLTIRGAGTSANRAASSGTVIGRVTFTTTAGRRTSIRVRLNANGRRLLAARRRLLVHADLRARNRAGTTRHTKTFVLRARPAARHRPAPRPRFTG